METIYHWVGLAVCWGLLALVVAAALWWAWEHRPKNTFTRRVGNAWGWLAVFVFGRRWHVSLQGARMLLTGYNRRPRKLSSWERDIIAVNIRYSRSLGWKEPYA